MTDRILLIEDDARLAEMVRDYLGEAGFRVARAASGGSGIAMHSREAFDAIVLDLMLPDMDGLDVCRQIRSRAATPILMLTARGDAMDRVIGLEMGADDYLPKPFNPRELLARIQALVRRQRVLGAHVGPTPESATVRFGPHLLRIAERRLERDGQDVPLTHGEFALLQALALNPNRPLGRDRLIELAHGRDHEATERSIDVQVMRLRKLIEADPARPRHIRTVWGVGYVFIPEASAETSR